MFFFAWQPGTKSVDTKVYSTPSLTGEAIAHWEKGRPIFGFGGKKGRRCGGNRDLFVLFCFVDFSGDVGALSVKTSSYHAVVLMTYELLKSISRQSRICCFVKIHHYNYYPTKLPRD